MDEDVRDAIPRPPLPEMNRAQGHIGFDFSTIHSGGQFGSTSTNAGLVLRADITRINGTHWNLSGYWRGGSDLDQQHRATDPPGPSQPHLSHELDLPESGLALGCGSWTSVPALGHQPRHHRRRVLRQALLRAGDRGALCRLTPDPTSWSYDPNRRIAGEFTNISGGSYDNVHYSSTFGFGVEHAEVERGPALRLHRKYDRLQARLLRVRSHAAGRAAHRTLALRRSASV